MDHPLTSSFQGLGIVIASLLALLNSTSQAQVISGLTAHQSGSSIVLELATVSSVNMDDLTFYYSKDGGSSWQRIHGDCLSPVSARSMEWAVLACLGVETFAGDDIRFKASASSCRGTVRFDGHDYRIVEIGDQCWFAENLRSEHYANGDAIQGNLTYSEWTSTTSGAQTIYDQKRANLETYGRLYNWYAVDDSRGLCPSGWHVPINREWKVLEMELGMTYSEANATRWRGNDQGAALKSSSTDSPSWNGTNASGFSALPGGLRNDSFGNFYGGGSYGSWWSASLNGPYSAWRRMLGSASDHVKRDGTDQRYGFSVRCLRDD